MFSVLRVTLATFQITLESLCVRTPIVTFESLSGVPILIEGQGAV